MFKMEMRTGGAAFRSDYETNKDGDTFGTIMDTNGNKVGTCKYE